MSANSVGLKVTKRCPDSTQKCVASAVNHSLSEIGSLLSDGDVLFALHNLKKIGSVMRANTKNTSQSSGKNITSRILFTPIGGAVIKTEPQEFRSGSRTVG